MLNFILFCVAVLVVTIFCFWFRMKNHGLWWKFLYQTHLWLGIVSGIVLFIVALTGTLLVFQSDIVHFFDHDRYFVSHPNMTPLNVEDLIAKVEQDMNGNVYFVRKYSNQNNATYVMSVANNNTDGKTNTQIVDPYTGELLGVSTLFNFFNAVQNLHTSLFLPKPIGKIIVGSASLIFVVLALTGLFLWLPANFSNKKEWTTGFLVRFRKGKSLLVYDSHKTLGFYILIPILLMALTGMVFSFTWFRTGVNKVFNVQYSGDLKSVPPSSDAKPLPFAYFIKKADELLEYKDYRWIIYPDQNDATVYVKGIQIESFKLAKGESIVFERYTGEVLHHERSEDIPIGKKIVFLLHSLHRGSIFGFPTQIIYFLACLTATTLPVTGIIIWWRKLRKIKVTSNK
ncbi:MAG: PepSY domain-containing protein [Planctomycetaceae bacterium]|jgi:uncharacterized iron-regulated membrane protein|nr:PepSY domain-containing protein [Planctomycetaceae bacterium]